MPRAALGTRRRAGFPLRRAGARDLPHASLARGGRFVALGAGARADCFPARTGKMYVPRRRMPARAQPSAMRGMTKAPAPCLPARARHRRPRQGPAMGPLGPDQARGLHLESAMPGGARGAPGAQVDGGARL